MIVIDLSMDLDKHWRWPWVTKIRRGFQYGGIKHSHGEVSHSGPDHFIRDFYVHGFTHVDSPLHYLANTKSIDKVPIETFFGDCAVLDISYKKDKEPITANDLEENGENIKENDIVLAKSRLDEKYSYKTKEYWLNAPYFTLDACYWLVEKKVKAVALDFPFVGVERHSILLREGIGIIEYLCNVGRLTKKRVKLFAVPLKIIGATGSPCRAFAVEEVQ